MKSSLCDMTPSEVRDALCKLKSEFLTPLAWVGGCITVRGEASVFADPIGAGKCQDIAGVGDTWRAAVEALRTKLIAWSVERDLSITRRLALVIIDLTHAGANTNGQFLQAGFAQAEIDYYGRGACDLASKMAGGQKFFILRDVLECAE